VSKIFLHAIIALAFAVAAPFASADGDIQIRDPWVQAAPPNAKVLAAYLEIHNSSKKPWTLSSASSPAFAHVSIHQSMMHGEMMHMEQVKELAIPAQGAVTLKPGGLHLMLTDAKKPLKVGDQVPLTLVFKNGKKIAVKATVRSSQADKMEEPQHQMDHSGHGNHKP